MQLSATLVKGKARIKFDAPKGTYTLARAQQSFRSLVHIHEKNGKIQMKLKHNFWKRKGEGYN